ncbi:hypothetical protein [Chitinivorax sp. B]|uniref:hypothetical protein n=1 Tax=Chitinivorax sp. B TaxID=2502235 RepID=UPI0010F88F25|nr:hypothetical protein [Chitinivorax sp. B]
MRGLLIGMCLVVMAGCGKQEEPPVKLYEHEREQLKKAKEVEGTLLQADQAQRKAMEEQDGNTP